MAGESRRAVIAALAGNLAIAVTKFIAAALTKSSAMLAEAIHSLVDTGNGGLLLMGVEKSKEPPDPEHPFGHGRELYFWALIVGILIFGIGGGMSILEGVLHILNPHPAEDLWWNYATLAIAAIFEGTSWLYGWKAFRAERRNRGIVETIHVSKDPTSFSVLLEDSAALIGLLFAFSGIFFAHLLDNPALDGIASIVIGLLLCLVAIVMVYESKGLLIGEGVDKQTLQKLRALIEQDPSVEHLNRLLTLYLGPSDILLTIELRFRESGSSLDVRRAVERLTKKIQECNPAFRRIFFGAETLSNPELDPTVQ